MKEHSEPSKEETKLQSEQKTKEDILHAHFQCVATPVNNRAPLKTQLTLVLQAALLAMEEYASQFKPSGVKTEWISVKDRLPEEGRSHNWILAYLDSEYFSFPRMQTLVFNQDGKFKLNGEDMTEYVSHWMPLPTLPKDV